MGPSVVPRELTRAAKRPESGRAGGAYAIAYVHDGAVEIVEFDAAGRPIARTYGTVGEPEDEPGA